MRSAGVARRLVGAISENPSAARILCHHPRSAERWAISPADERNPPPARPPEWTGGGPESFRGMALQMPNHLSGYSLAVARFRAADPGCSTLSVRADVLGRGMGGGSSEQFVS